MKNICVIGAGIVGCATAYALTRAGFSVRLIDARSGPGLGTSFANGAQLSYSYVEPLASPATLRGLPGMLLDPDSPLRFELRLDVRQWSWGLKFLAACTAAQAERGTREVLELAQLSRVTLDDWREREDLRFSFRRNGKLVLCPNQATLDRQIRQVRFQATLGCEQSILSREECVAREPALGAYAAHFVSGVWTADECLGDTHEPCRELVRRAERDGATIRFDTRARSFAVEGRRVRSARTSAGDVPADAFVLAAGTQASALARQLGITLPIYPIKGYSLTLPIVDPARAPEVSVTDLGQKTVFARLDGHLRVAAMAEVVGHDLSIPPDRVDRMIASVEKLFSPTPATWTSAMNGPARGPPRRLRCRSSVRLAWPTCSSTWATARSNSRSRRAARCGWRVSC